MTATDELRALLMERNAQYRIFERQGKGTLAGAEWYYPVTGGYGGLYVARAIRYGDVFKCVMYLTPAQAVVATLGREECRVEGSTREWRSTNVWAHALSCGHEVETLDREPPRFCPECGAEVVGE